jgi:hypothetical protein
MPPHLIPKIYEENKYIFTVCGERVGLGYQYLDTLCLTKCIIAYTETYTSACISRK